MIHKITLMEAYLIETLRSAGISEEEILSKFHSRKLEDFQHIREDFDFTLLYPLSDRGDDVLEVILQEGYEIKFLTIHGLINMLQLKFHKVEDEDYERNDFVLSKLLLNDEETRILQQLLSPNWQMEKEQNEIIIKPV